MNGSSVIAKIAGIESTAKITSVTAINAMTTNIGVNQRTPSLTTVMRAAVVLVAQAQMAAHPAHQRIGLEVRLVVRRLAPS